MEKKRRIKLLELMILIIIIIIFCIILLIAKSILSESPTLSDTNNIENYSVTRYIKYDGSFESLSYPLNEFLDTNVSTYYIYIVSTDNLITDYKEYITLTYKNLSEEQVRSISSYCNSYDDVEYEYTLQCSRKDEILYITNSYKVNELGNTVIKSNKKDIDIPISKGTKLSDYLAQLDSMEINYFEVDEIE